MRTATAGASREWGHAPADELPHRAAKAAESTRAPPPASNLLMPAAHTSIMPALSFALRIAAAAVARRRGATLGPSATHAAVLVALRRTCFRYESNAARPSSQCGHALSACGPVACRRVAVGASLSRVLARRLSARRFVFVRRVALSVRRIGGVPVLGCRSAGRVAVTCAPSMYGNREAVFRLLKCVF